MPGDADVARVASMIGEPARAAVLMALADGRALPATTLASDAGVAPSTLSAHLARLVEGGLIRAEPAGRYRYFRLAGPEVVEALEALARLAPSLRVSSLRQATHAEALRRARTCYDHLAGRLGVAVCDALLDAGIVVEAASGGPSGTDTRSRSGAGHDVSESGRQRLQALGVDLRPGSRRPLVRTCIDWSEQRPHLAGTLGAALLEAFVGRGWVRPGQRRAVQITDLGRSAFVAELGVDQAAVS